LLRFVMRHRRWFLVPSFVFIALEVLLIVVAVRYPTLARADDCVSVARRQVCARVGRVPENRPTETASHSDPLYGRVVSTLAGRSVPAWCWSDADWRGIQDEYKARWPEAHSLGWWGAFTRPEQPSVHLSPAVCAELARLVSDPDPVWEADDADTLAWS